ncbi:MAG: toprim domain-containing protein [Pusillimonas sp.]|nr:toprim domain-containing protein [Pusillimonas sp.]
MNAAELSSYMAERAQDVAEHLLPNGKKISGEWRVGSLNGEQGQSLAVRISGAKKGTWKDFNAGHGGDLIDLWAMRNGISIAQAITEIKAHFNIRDESLLKPKQEYKRPSKPKASSPKQRVLEWFFNRGISENTLIAFRIAQAEQSGKVFAVFPYLRDGEYINGKYRNIDDKKEMRQEGGAEPCLFGWHLIDPNIRSIAICEGEIDAMTLHQVGVPALSVNAGAGNHQWIDNDWDRLDRFSEIYLCYDNDDAGQKGAREVANRLGADRCKIVQFGEHKDANEALMADFDNKDFRHSLACARTFDPEELRQLFDFWHEVKASFWPAAGEKLFPLLTFCGEDEEWFEFRPGEVSVWTGYNGHGKSMILNQVLIGLMKQGEKVCVFSGEMVPRQQGRRMAKQLTGIDRPSNQYLDAAGEWIKDRAWIFNLAETATLDRLIEVFRYGFKRYGIRHFVIDSLMMTDVPEDGPGAMSAQKEAMRKIATFARSNNVHVHLVAHPRKGDSEKKAPGKLDVAGSSKLTDAADNVWTVWADKKEVGERTEEPDGFLELHKQRNGDVQSKKLWLFFNSECQQYSRNKHRRPYQYVQFSSQEYA